MKAISCIAIIISWALLILVSCSTAKLAVFHVPKQEKAFAFSNINLKDNQVEINQDDIEDAYRYHEKALKKHPRDKKLLFNLASLALKKGDLQKSREVAQMILKLYPGDIEAKILMAKHFYQQKKYKIVQLICNNLVFKEVKNSEIYNLLGLTYYQLKDLTKAVSSFQFALVNDPNNIAARVNLGVIYLQYKDYPQALKEFSRVSRKTPHSIHVQFFMAVTLSQTGKVEKAVEMYQHVLKKRPDYVAAQYNLSTLYQNKEIVRNDEIALEYLEGLLQKIGKKHHLYSRAYQNLIDIKERNNIETISHNIEKALNEELPSEKQPVKKVEENKTVSEMKVNKEEVKEELKILDDKIKAVADVAVKEEEKTIVKSIKGVTADQDMEESLESLLFRN